MLWFAESSASSPAGDSTVMDVQRKAEKSEEVIMYLAREGTLEGSCLHNPKGYAKQSIKSGIYHGTNVLWTVWLLDFPMSNATLVTHQIPNPSFLQKLCISRD